MSASPIRLYFDEDVSIVIAEMLRGRGYEVQTTRDAGNLHLQDIDQLEYAAAHSMALVTHNRKHFEQLASGFIASGRSHAGIIVAVRHPEPEIARRLLLLLQKFTAEEMQNLLLYT